MERSSFLYKLRRKGQVVAHKLLPDVFLSKFYYKTVLGKKLNLKDPKTFNEKIQWMKLYLYPFNDEIVTCTDKYKVRDYLIKKGYKKMLVPLLFSWNNANDIDFEKLPEKFVLKCNHGCAYNIVVSSKNNIEKEQIVKQLNKWLKEDFGAFNIELHYSKIKQHKIICEEYLGDNITDYKFFCFNGEPMFMYVSNDLVHDRQAKIGFFNLDGSKIPLKRDDYQDILSIELPSFFEEMKQIAKDLSSPFPFVRVDFFLANNRYYFAELTFTPGAGMMPFNPDYYDKEWGNLIDLSKIKKGE